MTDKIDNSDEFDLDFKVRSAATMYTGYTGLYDFHQIYRNMNTIIQDRQWTSDDTDNVCAALREMALTGHATMECVAKLIQVDNMFLSAMLASEQVDSKELHRLIQRGWNIKYSVPSILHHFVQLIREEELVEELLKNDR